MTIAKGADAMQRNRFTIAFFPSDRLKQCSRSLLCVCGCWGGIDMGMWFDMMGILCSTVVLNSKGRQNKLDWVASFMLLAGWLFRFIYVSPLTQNYALRRKPSSEIGTGRQLKRAYYRKPSWFRLALMFSIHYFQVQTFTASVLVQ